MHSASGLGTGGVFVLYESQFKTVLLLIFTFCKTREYQFIRMQKNYRRGRGRVGHRATSLGKYNTTHGQISIFFFLNYLFNFAGNKLTLGADTFPPVVPGPDPDYHQLFMSDY